MDGKLKKRGGFTFVEMAATIGMAAFALGGFMLLWAGMSKQQTISDIETIVDTYGNFVMYRINQDFKNAYTYQLFQSGGYSGVDMRVVDYSGQDPDTMLIRWTVDRTGNAWRSLNHYNSTITTRMFSESRGENTEFGAWVSRTRLEKYNMYMQCDSFKIKPARDLFGQEDYIKLDSSAVQLTFILRLVKYNPSVTVWNGETGSIAPNYTRVFRWTTMLYLENFFIYRYNSGKSQF